MLRNLGRFKEQPVTRNLSYEKNIYKKRLDKLQLPTICEGKKKEKKSSYNHVVSMKLDQKILKKCVKKVSYPDWAIDK